MTLQPFSAFVGEDMMRSYEAARSLFSFLAGLAWLLIAIGIVAAIGGGAGGGDMAEWNRTPWILGFLIGTVPGIAIVIIGFISLALAQIGRAGVDSAEYSQQMLQISRDQLEVSRQSLRQGEQVRSSFEALRTATAPPPTASFAGRNDAAPVSYSAALSSPSGISYRGKEIQSTPEGYKVDGWKFVTVAEAETFIDLELGKQAPVLRAERSS